MLVNAPHTAPQKNPKLPLLVDGLACIGALGGTIASVVTQQVMFATVPLSVMFAVQVVNRHRQQQQLITDQFQANQAIHHLDRSFQTQEEAVHSLELDTTHHCINVFTLERLIQTTDQEQQYTTQKIHLELTNKLQDLDKTVEKLRAIVAESQGGNVSSTEVYYKRGLNQEELGHLDAAIADYSHVIQQEPAHAFAFYRRGLAYLQIGKKQAALRDLNTASRNFFGDGDLKNYELAKEKVNEIHVDESSNVIHIHSMTAEAGAPISVNTLFGG